MDTDTGTGMNMVMIMDREVSAREVMVRASMGSITSGGCSLLKGLKEFRENPKITGRVVVLFCPLTYLPVFGLSLVYR